MLPVFYKYLVKSWTLSNEKPCYNPVLSENHGSWSKDPLPIRELIHFVLLKTRCLVEKMHVHWESLPIDCVLRTSAIPLVVPAMHSRSWSCEYEWDKCEDCHSQGYFSEKCTVQDWCILFYSKYNRCFCCHLCRGLQQCAYKY